jgi:hypothetical protein
MTVRLYSETCESEYLPCEMRTSCQIRTPHLVPNCCSQCKLHTEMRTPLNKGHLWLSRVSLFHRSRCTYFEVSVYDGRVLLVHVLHGLRRLVHYFHHHVRRQGRRPRVQDVHQLPPFKHQHIIIIINFIVSIREIYINRRRSASAQMAEPGIRPRTFQLLSRCSIH